jgi:hypothetical protein
MNTAEVAEQLKTSPKLLRRFLRADPTYMNAANTTDRRYTFEEKDMATLKKRFNKWNDSKPPKRAASTTKAPNEETRDGDTISTKLLRSRDPRVRAEIKRRAEARVDNLEVLLKSKGHHISQLKAS